MTASNQRPGLQLRADSLTPSERRALLLLLDAHDAAVRHHHDPWQFALELATLAREGAHDTALRCLIVQGLVAHALETTPAHARRRTVRPSHHLHFTDRSCFVLTEIGLAMARQDRLQEPTPSVPILPPTLPQDPRLIRPSFRDLEDGRRELRVLDFLVKRFSARAGNQELILRAWQEEEWVRRILDPIPPEPGLDSKRRLHDAIARLNRHQVTPLLRFRGDGSAQGLYWQLEWEALQKTANSAPTACHQGAH